MKLQLFILCVLQEGKVCSEKFIFVQDTKSSNFQHSKPLNQIVINPLNQDTDFISRLSSENWNTCLQVMLHHKQTKRRPSSLGYLKKLCAHHKSCCTKLNKHRNNKHENKKIEKKTLAFSKPGCGRRHCTSR